MLALSRALPYEKPPVISDVVAFVDGHDKAP
jgi:hypothetical protein